MTTESGLWADCGRVVDRYSDLVYKLAYARMRNKADAEDIFQEVFLRYIRKKPSFEDETNAKAWFIRVTVNCCKSLWRAPFRRHVELPQEDAGYLPEQNDLRFLVDQLPEPYREVVHLFYYEDLSVAEISRALKRKESTVRVQLMRSRKLLRDELEGDGSDAE